MKTSILKPFFYFRLVSAIVNVVLSTHAQYTYLEVGPLFDGPKINTFRDISKFVRIFWCFFGPKKHIFAKSYGHFKLSGNKSYFMSKGIP